MPCLAALRIGKIVAWRVTDRQDDELEQEIQRALAHHPSFGYKRLTAVINRQRQKNHQAKINAKRVYRVAKQRSLLLTQKPLLSGYSKEHNGHVSVDQSNKRWCSDELEFKCFNGEYVSMTFVLDCYDREVISFVAKKGRWAFIQVLDAVEPMDNCDGTRNLGNIGLMASLDPVALDQAAIDMTFRAAPNETTKEAWHRTHMTYLPMLAEQIGVGKTQYVLQTID